MNGVVWCASFLLYPGKTTAATNNPLKNAHNPGYLFMMCVLVINFKDALVANPII